MMKARTGMIAENELVKGNTPWTKPEVRAVTIAKLDIASDHQVLDIGAGTGTVTLEVARRLKQGQVVAVEKKEEGCSLIRANMDKFSLKNIELIKGAAPACLPDRKWDRVFIGGSGGSLEEIIDYLKTHLRDGGIVVVNTVTLDTLGEAVPLLKEAGFMTEVIMLQVSRIKEIGDYSMYSGENPIHVITAKKV